MENFQEFFVDILTPFFHGIMVVFSAIFDWVFGSLNIVNYVKIISEHSREMSLSGNILIIFTMILLIGIYVLIAYGIYRLIKRYIKYRKNLKNHEDLDEELDILKSKLARYEADNAKYGKMIEEDSEENVLKEDI